MSTYYGYGINTSRKCFKPNAAQLLWEKAKNIDWVKEEYAEYLEYNGDPEANYQDYIEDYENDTTCNTGFEAFLVDVINEFVDPIERPFVYDDCVIFVPATIPANDTEKASMLTQQRIREILAEHVNPLIKGPFTIGWFQIQE